MDKKIMVYYYYFYFDQYVHTKLLIYFNTPKFINTVGSVKACYKISDHQFVIIDRFSAGYGLFEL